MNSFSVYSRISSLLLFAVIYISSAAQVPNDMLSKYDADDIDRMYCMQIVDSTSNEGISYSAISYNGEIVAVSYYGPQRYSCMLREVADCKAECEYLNDRYLSDKGINAFIFQKLGYIPPLERTGFIQESGSGKSQKSMARTNKNNGVIYQVHVLNDSVFEVNYVHTAFFAKTDVLVPQNDAERKGMYDKYFTVSGAEAFIRQKLMCDSIPEFEITVDFAKDTGRCLK